uniref:ZZ-type domain-containing protein n=1 Tax=Aureoumbra lagunensis TaxID=44058 RepID=A0A7S3JQN1_9STRA|mmetsp:Transcript_1430/g.1875  ORF Transcript_1430/g.1875 Transcript_1430/m.1875 type:complete len:162 (+) Transcript_1430:26-511(+)
MEKASHSAGDEQLLELRKKEIAEKVAKAKAERERVENERLNYFGTHKGISCDGCGAPAPIVGYRYHCKSCANHDVCENCFSAWDNGKGTVSNILNQQKLSTNPADHHFVLHKDKGFKPMAKGAGARDLPSSKKIKPNDPCTCDSGKKFKKCCGSVTRSQNN